MNAKFTTTNNDIFLSIIIVFKNQATEIIEYLESAQKLVGSKVADYEFIIVDNASVDNSSSIYKAITGIDGLPNLQVFVLTQEVDEDTAICVGLENALGDSILVLNSNEDDLSQIDEMLSQSSMGYDVVFAENVVKKNENFIHKYLSGIFMFIYKSFTGFNLNKQAPKFRLLSKKVVNYILQFPKPAITYRLIPASSGFELYYLTYSNESKVKVEKSLGERITRSVRLLINTTYGPLRFVNTLCLLGALSNFIYSMYVLFITFFKKDVAPGWTTLSLQLSGMFFLISLVLFIFGEYLLSIKTNVDNGPSFFVSKEYTSKLFTKRMKLNVEENPEK